MIKVTIHSYAKHIDSTYKKIFTYAFHLTPFCTLCSAVAEKTKKRGCSAEKNLKPWNRRRFYPDTRTRET